MRKFNFFTLCILFSLPALAGFANAQYWFQSGAVAGTTTSYNNGASVSIQTLTGQNIGNGALAFWVGETLSNGAFLQVGYIIENQTGTYPTDCSPTCSSTELLNAGDAEWFYEYFPVGQNNTFYGSIGPDGSAGANGTIHTYSFFSEGDTWYFFVDGKQVGSADLNASSSGRNVPTATEELANTNTAGQKIKPVVFSNLSEYKNGKFIPVLSGYAFVGYGSGSDKSLSNPYGVEEIGNRANYFEAGSGIPATNNGKQLWTLNYMLTTSSQYGNLSTTANYNAYSQIKISEPSTVYINGTSRAVFKGWSGTGAGSYTGNSNTAYVTMNSNITETAMWQLQYYVNVTSNYTKAFGSGWYANGTEVKFGIDKNVIYENSTTRYFFMSWSDGLNSSNSTAIVSAPLTLSANFNRQYYVNITSQYGSTTGTGWINAGASDLISVSTLVFNATQYSRTAFVNWTNGSSESKLNVTVYYPFSLHANYVKQYRISLLGKNINNQTFLVPYFLLASGERLNDTPFLGIGNYSVESAYYEGVNMPINYSLHITGPGTYYVILPIFNVNIKTVDLFGLPVNASIQLKFANGTALHSYSGQSGTLSLSNLPLGYAYGSASFFGLNQTLTTISGETTYIIFISPLNDIAFSAITLSVIAAALELRHKRLKLHKEILNKILGKGQVSLKTTPADGDRQE